MTRLTMTFFYHLFSQGGANHISMYMQPIIWNFKMFENPMKAMYLAVIGNWNIPRERERKSLVLFVRIIRMTCFPHGQQSNIIRRECG